MASVKVQMSDRMKRWQATGDQVRLNKAVSEGTRKLLPKVQAAVIAKLDKSLKHPTGTYKRTITSKVYATGTGVVKSTDKRQIKDWLETRRRGGVRLGTGAYAWRAGKTFAKNANKAGFYHDPVKAALK